MKACVFPKEKGALFLLLNKRKADLYTWLQDDGFIFSVQKKKRSFVEKVNFSSLQIPFVMCEELLKYI